MRVHRMMGTKGWVAGMCAVVALWGGSGESAAQTGGLDHSPAEVVKKYLSLDQKGARLDAMSVDAVVPYTSWRDEPVWGQVIVTRAFTVSEHYSKWDVVNKMEVVIPVTFQILGSIYLETAGFVPDARSEEVRFRVKSVKNRWRIMEPMLPPHVGQKRAINFVREAWIKETEPAKRETLAALQDELRKVK